MTPGHPDEPGRDETPSPGEGHAARTPEQGAGPDPTTPLAAQESTEELTVCPACRTTTGDGPYCENCGSRIEAAEPVQGLPGEGAPRSGGMLVLGGPAAHSPASTSIPEDDQPRCQCGGGYADGYCEQCGSPRPDPRDHTEDAAAPWVAGVSDVGVHHESNQDAMALVVDGSRAGLVVCDGVSTALRSEDASQAAADAAVTILGRATSTGVGVPSSLVPAMSARLDAATDAASDAVADITRAVHRELGDEAVADAQHANPSCTIVAAAIDGGHVVVGSVGDSRAYWFPDDAPAVQLTIDDSWAEEQISLGATREQAESGPGAHTITRWLGVDAPEHTPRKASFQVDRAGWLLLCSDGLWNYASDPAALATALADVAAAGEVTEPPRTATEVDAGNATALTRIDPLTLARGLVTWANARGGHDNITVITARLNDPRSTREGGTDG